MIIDTAKEVEKFHIVTDYDQDGSIDGFGEIYLEREVLKPMFGSSLDVASIAQDLPYFDLTKGVYNGTGNGQFYVGYSKGSGGSAAAPGGASFDANYAENYRLYEKS